jgi:NhaP-type Na+/H+ or K+/H+ antiporter
MIIGNYGKTKISPKVETSIHQFIDFFAFASNGAIFLLMGLIVQQQNIEIRLYLLPIIGITIVVMIAARACSVYGTL